MPRLDLDDQIIAAIDAAPIYTRDIEQGLEQINRLPSNNARTSMLTRNDDGTSILNIKDKPGKRWNTSLSNSNLSGIAAAVKVNIQRYDRCGGYRPP